MCVLEEGAESQLTGMEKIKIKIDNKLQTIDGISKEYIRKSIYVPLQNYIVFRESASYIDCYQHEFQVTDLMLFFSCMASSFGVSTAGRP